MKKAGEEVFVFPLFLALFGGAAAQTCDAPASAVELAREVAAAEAAFVAMDADGFETARAGAERLLPCLDEPITAVDAAGVHRIQALAAFARGDQSATERAYRAVLELQPAWTLSERLAPPGTPLDVAYQAARSSPESATAPLAPPEKTTLSVDGARAEARPTERPFVLQAQSRAGLVTHTGWFEGNAALPEWAEVPAPPAEPDKPVKQPGEKRPLALLGTAVGSAVVAGSAYTAAWAGRARYKNEATPMGDLQGIKSRTNGAVLVAMGFSGVTVGTGVALGVAW